MALSFKEQLCYTTTRIGVHNDTEYFTGTGFFYNFLKYDVKGKLEFRALALVTNKHITEDCNKLEFNLPIVKKENCYKEEEDIEIEDLTFKEITVSNLEDLVINHPDESVDLSIILITKIISDLQKTDQRTFFKTFDHGFVLDPKKAFELLDAVEEIIMIGYPNGIWDETNNLPVFRRGITATHPAVNYNGLKEFMIDAACFTGSSGSPVFLLDSGASSQKKSKETIRRREILLGIMSSGETMYMEGKMKRVKVQTKKSKQPVVETFLNLGYVIKSERLVDFDELIWKKYPLN